MIINNGIITEYNSNAIVDKIKIDYIIKLSFHFYKKLCTESKYFNYLKNWFYLRCENCDQQCDNYRKILDDKIKLENQKKFFEKTLFVCNNKNISISCLNCGKLFKLPDYSQTQLQLPICNYCSNVIKNEIEVWKKLFD